MAPFASDRERGEDAVNRELRRWASEPFDLGRANCLLSVLGYVERRVGRRLWWPRLLSRFAAKHIWGRDDRIEAVSRRAMAQLGCSLTGAPTRGDVGLVDLPEVGLVACLCIGLRNPVEAVWAARMARGVVIQPGAPALAWRVTCPRR